MSDDAADQQSVAPVDGSQLPATSHEGYVQPSSFLQTAPRAPVAAEEPVQLDPIEREQAEALVGFLTAQRGLTSRALSGNSSNRGLAMMCYL
jgi:hypothetical protein